jgi:hypothetical protein
MIASMSRKADCWDNAPVESFFATLKTELASAFVDLTHARAALAEYIAFYNHELPLRARLRDSRCSRTQPQTRGASRMICPPLFRGNSTLHRSLPRADPAAPCMHRPIPMHESVLIFGGHYSGGAAST